VYPLHLGTFMSKMGTPRQGSPRGTPGTTRTGATPRTPGTTRLGAQSARYTDSHPTTSKKRLQQNVWILTLTHDSEAGRIFPRHAAASEQQRRSTRATIIRCECSCVQYAAALARCMQAEFEEFLCACSA
jgi:hypothetical protein